MVNAVRYKTSTIFYSWSTVTMSCTVFANISSFVFSYYIGICVIVLTTFISAYMHDMVSCCLMGIIL